MKIAKMAEEFKKNDLKELQKYCDSQFATITELSKEIKKLEEENKSLKKILENSSQLLDKDERTGSIIIVSSDSEAICVLQLTKLKTLGNERELTYEEAKKVDIYTKLLFEIREGNKDKADEKLKNLTDAELIKLVK